MRIIDNKKDYYDYLAGVWVIDGHITYDRRNSTRLVNKTSTIITERYPMGYGNIFCTWKNGRDPEYDYVNPGWKQHIYRMINESQDGLLLEEENSLQAFIRAIE